MRKQLALLAASVTIGTPAWSAPTAQVELRALTTVDTDAVVLGQVAYIRSTDLELVRSLVNLRIGPAPRFGASASVSRQALDRWIRRQTGTEAASLAWTGEAERITVVRASQQVEGQRIADVALKALRDRLAAEGRPAQVDLRSAPASVAVEPGDLRLQVRDVAATQLRPHLLVWVDIAVDGRRVRAIPVPLAIEAADLPMPPRSEVRVRSDDTLRAAGPHAPVRRALAVQRGESAALRETSGAIALESRVEVLQDGAIGDRVRVRATHWTGLMLARVVGPGLLEIAP